VTLPLAYQPPASGTFFLSEQISHQQPASSPKESSIHEGLNKIYLQNLFIDECNFA
jgi:hypothetical protein